MLEPERDVIGVAAELTGMFARSVGQRPARRAPTPPRELLVVGSSDRRLPGRVLVGDDARGTASGGTCLSPSPLTIPPTGPGEIKTNRPPTSWRRPDP